MCSVSVRQTEATLAEETLAEETLADETVTQGGIRQASHSHHIFRTGGGGYLCVKPGKGHSSFNVGLTSDNSSVTAANNLTALVF